MKNICEEKTKLDLSCYQVKNGGFNGTIVGAFIGNERSTAPEGIINICYSTYSC